MPTGVPGLDRLLNGGLRQGGLHIVLGGPGTGKSVLAHQIGANLIRAGGKVLYLTALVETHQTLISQARTFGFFDPAMVPGSFYYASLYPMLANGGHGELSLQPGAMENKVGGADLVRRAFRGRSSCSPGARQ